MDICNCVFLTIGAVFAQSLHFWVLSTTSCAIMSFGSMSLLISLLLDEQAVMNRSNMLRYARGTLVAASFGAIAAFCMSTLALVGMFADLSEMRVLLLPFTIDLDDRGRSHKPGRPAKVPPWRTRGRVALYGFLVCFGLFATVASVFTIVALSSKVRFEGRALRIIRYATYKVEGPRTRLDY